MCTVVAAVKGCVYCCGSSEGLCTALEAVKGCMYRCGTVKGCVYC